MSEEFIKEVDDELKEEKLAKLWRRLAPYIVGFSVGIILFVAGIVGWENYSKNKSQRIGDDFTSAVVLINEKDIDTALIALDEITDEASDGYVTMAKMKKATLLIKQNKVEEGLNVFLDLEKSAFDQSFKDMATIMYVLNAMDYKSSDELLKKIERLTFDSEWSFSALELKAFLFLKKNDKNSANEVFEKILSKKNPPSTLAGRARDMIDHLKGL